MQVDSLEEKKIRQVLEPAHHVASLKKEVVKDQRVKTKINRAENMTPLEALNQYYSTKKKAKQVVKDITRAAQDIIKEVDQEN